MAKWITVVEIDSFINIVSSLLTDDEQADLIEFLAKFPETGDLMPGTGGLREIRWAAKGKGKRGGVRIIYYFYNETAPLFLITAYAKNVQENLTPKQEKQLVQIAKILKTRCKM